MAVIVIIIVGKISFIESPPSTSLYFTMIFQLSISSIYYNVHFDSYYKIVWFSRVVQVHWVYGISWPYPVEHDIEIETPVWEIFDHY